MAWILSLVLLGTVSAQGLPSCDAPLDAPHALSSAVAGNESAAQVLQQVKELSPERRAEAAASIRVLAVNCPYTRSALQLPIALHVAVLALDAGDFHTNAQGDLLALQRGLAQHVAVLDLLKVDLALPVEGDGLAQGPADAFVDRDALLTSPDPVGLAAALVRDTNRLARRLSSQQLATIERHSDRVEQATGITRPCPRDVWAVQPGHPWTLGNLLRDWTDLLVRLEPKATSVQARQQIQQMRALLQAQAEANHEVRSE